LTLPLVEFAYNNAVNWSTGKSPFEIVPRYSPRTPSDPIPHTPDVRVSQPASTFANYKHIHDLYVEIRRKIAISNDSYKLSADVRRRDISFEVGDFVMARIQPKHLLQHFHKKLHARAIGSYQIIRKLGSNAYALDLPDNLGISPIFNVADLTLH